MANYCYNSVEFDNASEEGLAKFEKLLEDGDMTLNTGYGYLFEIEYHEDEEHFGFTTRWGTNEGAILFLIELLQPEFLTCTYEKGGMQIGGKYVYRDGYLIDYVINDLYWQTLGLYYESEDYFEALDMDDFFYPDTAFSGMLEYYTQVADDDRLSNMIQAAQRAICRNPNFKL